MGRVQDFGGSEEDTNNGRLVWSAGWDRRAPGRGAPAHFGAGRRVLVSPKGAAGSKEKLPSELFSCGGGPQRRGRIRTPLLCGGTTATLYLLLYVLQPVF